MNKRKINCPQLEKFYYYAFPMQAVLVTCNDKDNKTNAITIAWHCPVSKKPPLYGISVAPSRYSHELMMKSKEFVINFLPFDFVEKVNFCGTHTGRNIDKIQRSGLTLIPSKEVTIPSIKESYSILECKFKESIHLGDHTFFVGEIVNISYVRDAFHNNILENKHIQPIFYLGKNIYTTIGHNRDEF
jgi:flavin reductase (DIM6/NTAB) family NADH-FMN oxidoreductase RutF